jgi:hypothetical protein
MQRLSKFPKEFCTLLHPRNTLYLSQIKKDLRISPKSLILLAGTRLELATRVWDTDKDVDTLDCVTAVKLAAQRLSQYWRVHQNRQRFHIAVFTVAHHYRAVLEWQH